MSSLYHSGHRDLQDRFDSRRLADALEERVLRSALTEMDQKFIAACNMFFLTTVDRDGMPTVSYKGGNAGFVRVLDDRTMAFPIYDGNGMFYSMGNILENPKVGMLFIDFQRPRRLRVHGEAKLLTSGPLISEYPEAKLVVRVALSQIFTNCARYIHPMEGQEISKYVPSEGRETPVPDWKRVDYLQEALPDADKERAKASGDVTSEEEYRKEFWKGL